MRPDGARGRGAEESRIRRRRRRGTGGGLARAGFTLVELLVSMAIVGILAGLALPNIRTMILRARAAELQGDMEVVRVATLNYHAENLTWPAETGSGTTPPGLTDFLPEGFDFVGEGYTLDFENWSLPGGLPGDPSTRTLIGVSVTTDDPELGNALLELLGAAIVFSVDNTHTIVIDRS